MAVELNNRWARGILIKLNWSKSEGIKRFNRFKKAGIGKAINDAQAIYEKVKNLFRS